MRKIVEFYNSFKKNDGDGNKMRSALLQRDWLSTNVCFDPKTGELLARPLSEFLRKISQPKDGALHDRLWRIAEHSRASIDRILNSLNKTLKRKHGLLPIHSARYLDSNSFIWLSRRSGRNIREKLAGTPHIKAVRRFQSVDVLENRLFKKFVSILLEALELRKSCLGGEPDELSAKIQNWLYSDEAAEIGTWENPPPNNTLLSHRDYRRIWDSWRWLQSLDEDLERDLSLVDKRQKIIDEWMVYAKKYASGDCIFAEIPIFFDYDNFRIEPFSNRRIIFKKTENKAIRDVTPKNQCVNGAVCVDFTLQHPRYAYKAGTKIIQRRLSDAFIWQFWECEDESIDVNLFNSDAAFINDEVCTVSSADLFASPNNDRGRNLDAELDRAARSFSLRFRNYFKSDELLWIVPDYLNDFELGIVRRNINANFSKAQPIPRSVAAVFEVVDYSKIKEGFSVLVIDNICGKRCLTKLVAKFDKGLKNALPETRGFYWERQPSIVDAAESVALKKSYDIFTVDSGENWIPPREGNSFQSLPLDAADLKNDAKIGVVNQCINISKTPVVGGVKLHNMQRGIEFPLWCDHIQELSIKVRKNGRLQRVCLVDERNSTVRPIWGKKIGIPIADTFILSKGKQFYSLPIYIGKNDDELGFSARLDSPQFPFKQDTNCKLSLTYDYGSDEPYKLTFIPCNRNLHPINASWQRTEVEKNITDAPAPKYPKAMTWEDLKSVLNPNTGRFRDMLDWVLSAIDNPLRKIGKISRDWIPDRNGKFFTHAESGGSIVFIHQNNFIKGYSYSRYQNGDEISYIEKEQNNSITIGTHIADKDYSYISDIDVIKKRMYVPFIITWGDGRSISDFSCPKDFASKASYKIKYINSLLRGKLPKKTKDAYRFILSCLHKDTTDDCIDWISKICRDPNRNKYYARHVGFALGGVSEYWQRKILKYLLENIDEFTIYVFSYAIWREKHFVDKFTISELNKILNRLLEVLKNVKYRSGTDDVNFLLTRALELLLGLLRTRDSTNEEIKMLLQPHQKITKDFSREIDYIANIAEENNLFLFSRIELDMKKPCDDKTPDLLYALRLYLDNEDDANAITINSISENPFEK